MKMPLPLIPAILLCAAGLICQQARAAEQCFQIITNKSKAAWTVRFPSSKNHQGNVDAGDAVELGPWASRKLTYTLADASGLARTQQLVDKDNQNVEFRVLKSSGSAFFVTYVKNTGGKKNLNDGHVGLKNGNLTIGGDTVK